MRKRNFLILLLLSRLWPVIGVSAQDAWKITAEQIEPSSYYGITVANGMLGLVSSPDPLKISRVVLGGLYDIYGKGRVNNFLHGINMLDTELQINGSTVKASQISGYKQTLDMRRGVFCGEFDYKSLARVEYQYTSLRHLPYSCLLRVRIIRALAGQFCLALKDRVVRLDSLDAGGLLREMEQMEQEGATFLDRQQGDTRRIRYVAPVVVTLLTVFLMGGLIALMLWGFSIDAEDAPPLPLLVVLVAIPGVVILGVLLAMIQRFREIEKGEAEDAKQY